MSVSLVDKAIEAHGGQYLWNQTGHPLNLFSVMEGWVDDVEFSWK
jgi:hypothetical protein